MSLNCAETTVHKIGSLKYRSKAAGAMVKRASAYSFFYRFVLNLMPCIRSGGGKVVALNGDFTYLKTRLRLSWRTINIMGTIYGGSMYASTDPMFMIMLMEILGKKYVVWDKGCAIRFKRPAKKTMFCEFIITPEMLAEVRSNVERDSETTFTWTVAYKDKNGIIYSEFDKILYVAKKEFYLEKLQKRKRKSEFT
jgi:hypothetical protein